MGCIPVIACCEAAAAAAALSEGTEADVERLRSRTSGDVFAGEGSRDPETSFLLFDNLLLGCKGNTSR